MPAANRTSRLGTMFDVLKKHYRPVPSADPRRPILEHLLFGCCLENTRYEVAEEAFGALLTAFFDYNEMRVSSIRELSEVMAVLPDARAAAFRIKRCLQYVFEAEYTFDLDDCRKGNLGPTVERLQKINGADPFIVSYVVQTALGGHSLPVDSGTLSALAVLDLVSKKNVEEKTVPGLERAVSKANGPAYGSLLHQLGADFFANPYDKNLHKLLLEINPECQSRLPTRAAAKAKTKEPEPSTDSPEPTEEASVKKAERKKAPAGEGEADVEPKTSKKTHAAKKRVPATKKAPKDAEKKSARPKKAVPATRKKKAADPEKKTAKTKKLASSQLSKRKPR
jgi:hypothetical protein